jgi:4-carboxymuconolactone decarboxylase
MGLASIERFRTMGCRSSNADKFSLSFPALNFALFAVKLQLTPGFRIEAFALTTHVKATRRFHPNRQELFMADEPTNARKSFGDLAPHLAEITDKVLFGDVWENPALPPRDRSLVTITSLISLYRTNELPFHMKRALENGITKDEIIATITHLAFYAGWPPAMTALQIARKVFAEAAG